MMFYYMWRQQKTAEVAFDFDNKVVNYKPLVDNPILLPFGVVKKPDWEDVKLFLYSRLIPPTRDRINQILKQSGFNIYDMAQILSYTSGVQYADYGWFMPVDESIEYTSVMVRDSFHEIVPFRTPYYLRGNQFKFITKNNCIFKEDFLGYEGLSEYLATCIAKQVHYPYGIVEYYPGHFQSKSLNTGITGCYSKSFMREGIIEIPIARLYSQLYGIDICEALTHYNDNYKKVKHFIIKSVEMLSQMKGLEDFGLYLSTLLEFDYLILNDDRHLNNITVFYNEHTRTFELPSLFDCGGGFLSNQYLYPLDCDIDTAIESVKARPFCEWFDIQCEIMKECYGSLLTIPSNVYIPIYELKRYYDKELIDRAVQVMLIQFNKLYPNTKVEIINEDNVMK